MWLSYKHQIWTQTPQCPHWSWAQWCIPATQGLGRQTQADPRSLQTGQSNQGGSQWEALPQKIRWRMTKTPNINLWLIHTHTYTNVSMNLSTRMLHHRRKVTLRTDKVTSKTKSPRQKCKASGRGLSIWEPQDHRARTKNHSLWL